jgi:hypothetical protein
MARLCIPRLLVATAIGFVAACPDEGQGPIDDCPAYTSMTTCEDGEGCAWDPEDGECVVDCSAIESKGTCNDQERCFWDGRVCHFGTL